MQIAPEILISVFFSQESLLAPGTQLKAGRRLQSIDHLCGSRHLIQS